MTSTWIQKMFGKGEEKVKNVQRPLIQTVKSTPKEWVLCFNASLLDQLGSFQGLLMDPIEVKRYREVLLNDENLFYVDREKAEKDTTLKQVIPYVVFRRSQHLFRYRRTKKGGESRLHGLWSIGVGGHINPVDGKPGKEAYEKAFLRELAEEVSFKGEVALTNKIVGLINDDSNEVGKVHFGIVHMLDVGFVPLELKDEALTDGAYLDLPSHQAQIEKYENWSKILVGKLTL